jgi:hypothetical protein
VHCTKSGPYYKTGPCPTLTLCLHAPSRVQGLSSKLFPEKEKIVPLAHSRTCAPAHQAVFWAWAKKIHLYLGRYLVQSILLIQSDPTVV